MSKNTFEVWDKMNQMDILHSGVESREWLLRMGVDFVSANYNHKKGVSITMGMAGSAQDILDLESGKKKVVLVLYDDKTAKFLADEK